MTSAGRIKKIFGSSDRIAIGAIHLPPLLGYPDFPGMKNAVRNALRDLAAFESAGFDAVIFENNYDIPHREFVTPAVVASLGLIGQKIASAARIPVGISVLWNDYPAALGIAKLLSLSFIRIPVFVDTVKTSYGIIRGNAQHVLRTRTELKANNVAILTDIHVKHAKVLSPYTLEKSATLAIKGGSDGLILTGKWTGDAPDTSELARVRKKIGMFPLLVGSGADASNIRELLAYANGAIVSTALKTGLVHAHETNLKAYTQRISADKARTFVYAAKHQKDA
ncbi:MAG: BtpA/SgcQ family protein [Patescibacteria group bacterium]